MDSIIEAVSILPKIRNRFDIKIKPPKGSMYPQIDHRETAVPVYRWTGWLRD